MNYMQHLNQHGNIFFIIKKLNYLITIIILFAKFFPIKNAMGQEMEDYNKKLNTKFNSSSQISEKEIIGAERYFLKRWIYKRTKFQNIIKAQLKNKAYFKKKKKNYEKKKISKNSGKTFSYLIEKISENEKLFSKKIDINLANLRINGVRTISLKKNNEKPEELFSVEEKNYKFLKYMNKFSIFNPDFQSNSSVLSSLPEIKKISEIKGLILFDPLKSLLLQNFSSKSGSFPPENNLTIKSMLGYESKRNKIQESREIEKKKSLLFRKKKNKSKKNIISKKKIIAVSKKFSFKVLHSKKIKQIKYLRGKTTKNKKIHANSISKNQSSKTKKTNNYQINYRKKENRTLFNFLNNKNIPKKNFPIFFGKFKKIKLQNLRERKQKRIEINRFFGTKNYKTTFSVYRIKNYIKFLSLIKKKKKKKNSKKSSKFYKNFTKFKFQKIFSVGKNRKSFPFRNNSFSNFTKKFISNKFLNNVGKDQSSKTLLYSEEKIIKIYNPRKYLDGYEKLKSKNKFSKFKEKRKYFNIIHSKDSYFLLEKKGMFHLGSLYSRGKLIPRSFFKTIDVFSKISKLGHSKSFIKLSEFYFKGKGALRNRKKSFGLIKSAVKRGEKKSVFNLAFMQGRGLGVKNDPLKSIFFYKKIGTFQKKNKIGSKIQKKIKKSNFSKIFYQFTKNPNETDLTKCYLSSLSSNRALSFQYLILRNANHVSSILEELNRLTFYSTFNSIWNLGEVFLNNRQYYLTSKKKEQIFDYYPNEFTSTNYLYFSQKSPFIMNFLLGGDIIFQENKCIHIFIFRNMSFILKTFLNFFFYLSVFITSTYFEFFYMGLVGFYLFIFPFL